MGFFDLHATCAICGKKIGLNRYLVGKTTRGECIWKCPECTRKGGLLQIDYNTGKVVLLDANGKPVVQPSRRNVEQPPEKNVEQPLGKEKKAKKFSLLNAKLIIAVAVIVMMLVAILSGFDEDVLSALYVTCFIVAVVCLVLFFEVRKDTKTFSAKTKNIMSFVGVLALILFVVFLVLSIVFNSGGGGSKGGGWDDLTKEEKQWYKDNYGNGQYDKYQDAINDYKNKK